MLVSLMRRGIKQKAGFDLAELDCLPAAQRSFIPALFCHAGGDTFIQPHHSQEIHDAYAVREEERYKDRLLRLAHSLSHYVTQSSFAHSGTHGPTCCSQEQKNA